MKRSDLRRSLRAHHGRIEPAARELGVMSKTLRAELIRRGLLIAVNDLRSKQRHHRRERIMELVVKHRGNLEAVARALKIRSSSLANSIGRHDLADFVKAARPSKPSRTKERARILDAIVRHHGQLRLVREELGISKGTLLARMKEFDLSAEADAQRIDAHLAGPRTRLPQGKNRTQRRAKLIALLESCNWKVSRANRLVGVSIGTLYSMMRDLDIERPSEKLKRERMHQLIDALRVSHGILERAAQTLGVHAVTVRAWCNEFEIEPRDYRR